MRAALFLFGFLLFPTASLAESDVLLQAVSFAITGSDASKVVAKNQRQCIFKVGVDDRHKAHQLARRAPQQVAYTVTDSDVALAIDGAGKFLHRPNIR